MENELLEALKDMVQAVCGPTGFAEAVRKDSGVAYPWEGLDLAEAAARSAIAKAEANSPMRKKKTPRPGKYVGELRSRFHIIEQWDGMRWREPPEVGDYGNEPVHLNFGPDEENNPYAGDEAFLPRHNLSK